jgi:hypothetical protein
VLGEHFVERLVVFEQSMRFLRFVVNQPLHGKEGILAINRNIKKGFIQKLFF